MGRDRGPLLSSLVLVGLATIATGLLVLIGVQAVKLPFDPRNVGTDSGRDDGSVISVPTASSAPPVRVGTAPGPAPTGPTTVRTAAPSTDRPKPARTGEQSTSQDPPSTVVVVKPTTKPPAPAPKPSQSTATTRPNPPATTAPPSPSPSPTCTAKDRTGKCKNSQDTAPTASPASRTGGSTASGSGETAESGAKDKGSRKKTEKAEGRSHKRTRGGGK